MKMARISLGLHAAGCELRATGCGLPATSCELRAINREIRAGHMAIESQSQDDIGPIISDSPPWLTIDSQLIARSSEPLNEDRRPPRLPRSARASADARAA